MGRHVLAVFLAVLVSAAAIPAFAAPFTLTLTETGTGSFVCTNTCSPLAFALAPDPGPGGLASVLTYTVPGFVGVQGDVFLFDPDFGAALDVLRFNGDGTVIFYSDDIDGLDSAADTPGPPGAFYLNQVTIDEIGSETDNGAFYTPGPLDPGADATYTFISDGAGPTAVPEPATLVLLGTGLLGLGGLLSRKKLHS